MRIRFIIEKLIESKREGDYWDFKREPHESKADLLHDIISLANSSHRGERYLILGVADPNDNCEIIGLTKEQKNRKTQNNFIDFLRTKEFAGDYRPEVELHTVKINGLEVDVLIVFDKPYKPYYLKKDFCDKSEKNKTIRANYIYTRVNDTNTPIDKSADIGKVEQMWRERFGLDLSPLEKMKILLLDYENWEKLGESGNYRFHKQNPEYVIEFFHDERIENVLRETFDFFYRSIQKGSGFSQFKYHSTVLFEIDVVLSDEARIKIPKPKFQYISAIENSYYYFDMSSPIGFYLKHLTKGTCNLSSRDQEPPVILYKNLEEKDQFEDYLVENLDLYNETEAHYSIKYIEKNMESWDVPEQEYSPKGISKVFNMYNKWKKHNMLR